MFYYELHSHTNTASLCSIVEPEEYIQFYIDRGFSGMVITDHFYHGNTSINRRLPWEAFIDEYCEGYYRAKKEGDKHGFTVLFGFEQKFVDGNDEYIVLGITPDWLKAHPEIRDMKRIPFFDVIHKAGGFIIQAHPFRVRYYISDVKLSLDYVDAIEVLNLGDEDVHSRRSYEYAKNLGLPMTAGTDIHSIENRDMVAGVALEKEIFTIEELIEEIKSGRAHIMPEAKFEYIKNFELNESVELDVYALTDDDLKLTADFFAKEYSQGNHP
ncbi:MAG: PHP domain-containing protein [Clostridia bacterium]|nr:PHP domain-containing protein [Clostridia bacterium]